MRTIKKNLAILAAAVAGLGLGGMANGAITTATWDGGSLVDSNWGTKENWVGDTLPTRTSTNYFVFTGSTRLVNTANTSGQFGGIVFDANAGSFTLNGTLAQDLNPGGVSGDAYYPNSVTQASANPQTINLPLSTRADFGGDGAGLVTITAPVAGSSGARSKTGASVYYLSSTGGATFGGDTRLFEIKGGGMIVANTSGSGLGANSVQVNSGAFLGGTGIITPGSATNKNKDVTIMSGGILSPGVTAGTAGTLKFDLVHATNTLASATSATTSELILASGSKFIFDLATTTTSDKVVLSAGVLRLNSQVWSDFTFNALAGFGAGTYTLFDSLGTTATDGSLGGSLNGTINGLSSTLSVSNGDVILTVVPEPTSLALAGLIGATGLLRRRRSA